MTPLKLKQLIHSRGLRQTEFARAAGISDALVSRYIRGQVTFNPVEPSHALMQARYIVLKDNGLVGEPSDGEVD